MHYVVETAKSPEEASADLEAAVHRHGFGVLHIHDLGTTSFTDRGDPYVEACKVFEVCEPPPPAAKPTERRRNPSLPCGIFSVFTEQGTTRIGLIRPSQMTSTLALDPAVTAVAQDVEKQSIAMVNEAR
jgi:uncharacterized protein (DUF302 family)